MKYQCPACGHEFEPRTTCPRCGYQEPADRPHNPTQHPSEPAAPLPIKQAGWFTAPAGNSSTSPRVPLIIGAVALALVLIAGGAYAVLRVVAPGVVVQSIGSGTTQLKVTGAAPNTRPWSGGYTEAWRANPARIVAQTGPAGEGNEGYAYAGRAENLAAFTVDTATASGTVLAVDLTTGKRVWMVQSGEQCSGMVQGLTLRCQGGRMGYYPTELVDMATGKSTETPSSQELGAKIPDGQEDAYRWSTFVVDGTLLAGWLDGAATESAPTLRVAKLADDGSAFEWTSERPLTGLGAVTDTDTIPAAGRINHGILTARWGALNAANGKVVLDGTGSDQPAAVQWVAQDVLQGGDQTSSPRSITAPDGASVNVIGVGGISVTTSALPKHPIRQTADGVAAFDPATGADSLTGPTLWSTKLGTSGSDDSVLDDGTNGDYLLAYHSGLIAVARQPGGSRAGVVSMLAEDTGALLWQATVIAPAGGESRAVIVPTFTAEGQLLVEATHLNSVSAFDPGSSELTMFASDSGDVLWARSGAVAGGGLHTLTSAPFAPEVETLDGIVVDNLDGAYSTDTTSSEGTFSMLRPRAASAADTPPADAPACPAGMSAISWTRYADGAILLCRADQRYAVVFPSHPDWQAAQLNWSGGGYEVVFSNGTAVRVSLGGTVVYTSANGAVTAQQATTSWNNVTGQAKFAVPSDLRSCPAGSWPISLSTYKGGWLLVCGTAADAPSSMFLDTGAGIVEVGSVVYRNGGYCGSADAGTVCGYRSPAMVSVTDARGEVTQHSVASNYFDGHGQGGAGEGNGSYGVETPKDNAKDQVRYLTQILQKSTAGRTSLQGAVDRVRRCNDVSGAISSFNDVLANRQELMDALDSTPVDAVPNGSALVASLRNALSLSHDSDQVWLQWAQAEQTNGCADGENSDLYRQVQTMNEGVATAKEDFLTLWNNQIVPSYHAPKFKTSQI